MDVGIVFLAGPFRRYSAGIQRGFQKKAQIMMQAPAAFAQAVANTDRSALDKLLDVDFT